MGRRLIATGKTVKRGPIGNWEVKTEDAEDIAPAMPSEVVTGDESPEELATRLSFLRLVQANGVQKVTESKGYLPAILEAVLAEDKGRAALAIDMLESALDDALATMTETA